MHPRVLEVTERLVERSRATRERYLAMIHKAAMRLSGLMAPVQPVICWAVKAI